MIYLAQYHDNYFMRVEYDENINSLRITSKNLDTNEEMIFLQAGDKEGLIKFNKETVDDYVSQAWGGALPAYEPDIGFIFSVDDVKLRKSLVSKSRYEEILKKYPKLPIKANGIQNDLHVNVVYAYKSVELDVETGKPVEGSMPETYIDNTLLDWYSRKNAPTADIKKLLPEEFIDIVSSMKTVDCVDTDPIEADIWRKYGSGTTYQPKPVGEPIEEGHLPTLGTSQLI